MQCPSCNGENPEATKFCIECGQPLRRICRQCGAENLPRAKFCGECGTALEDAAAGEPAPAGSGPRAGAPLDSAVRASTGRDSVRSYTPGHLAEKILTSRAAIEGERKQVTVLFADLKGSMELLAARDPEEARRILDPVLQHMMDAVHEYEGTVNQVMGDGIMALFGAPIAHEDHGVRACYAALRMQETVQAWAEEAERTHDARVQVRVGLNSGQVVVRSIGSDLRMDYTAVGQTTHLAARMEQTAEPGAILITDAVLTLAEGFVEVRSLGPVDVKGLDEPVRVHELIGAGSARTRLEAAAARGLTRFVGRAGEMDALRQAMDRATDGNGNVVTVVGEAGVGKSRLIREFIAERRTPDWLVLRSSAVSYGSATPYLPVIDLLKRYFRIGARDDDRRIVKRVTDTLEPMGEARFPTLPAVLALLDAPVGDPEWDELAPGQRRQHTLDAVRRLLLRESQSQPVLLVFEDLQWIDDETQAVLDGLVDSLASARLLLLLGYRPEYQHPWGNKRYYRQLRLDALPADSASELLEGLFGENGDLRPLKRLLIERTEGNPFFLEECVRALAESDALVGERGGYRLARSLPSIEVPATVQVVLAARIDRLPPEEKRLLQTAAVIGRDVPFALLQVIAELSGDDLRRGCAHLQAAEFLHEASLFPELEYTFRHALTHEVAYQSILQDRRRELHARIVDALEGLAGDRATEQVDRLAHHALRGEVWDRAVAYCREAGARAYQRAAHPQAVEWLEQALDALAHLPASEDRSAQAIDIRLDLHYALVPLGAFEPMLRHLTEAEALAEELDDRQRLGKVSSHLAHRSWIMGDHPRAIEAGERALAIASELEDPALEAETNLNLGLAYRTIGDYRRAMDCFGRNVSSLGDAAAPAAWSAGGSLSLASASYLVWCLAELGEFADGIARAEEGIRVAEGLEQKEALIFAYRALAYVYLIKGDLDDAIAFLERGLDLAQDLPGFLPWLSATLGYAHALSGRSAEGLPLLEEAAQRPASGARVGHAPRLTKLAEAYLAADRPADARDRAEEALEVAAELGERGQQAYALRLLGEIATRFGAGDREQAERRLREAVDLADELGMRPLLAHCHRSLHALYRSVGRSDEARAAETAATELYEALGMTAWLEA